MTGPEGVKLIRTDGTVLNCELIQVGPDEEGIDVWKVVGIKARDGDRLHVDVLPPRTSIFIDTDVNLDWRKE